MTTTLLTVSELLARDREIGHMLDGAPSRDMKEARDLLRERRAVRNELERRRHRDAN